MNGPQQAGNPKVRYFYRDPLAAAWMAKHFWMRFTNFGLDEKLNPEYSRASLQFYIHPDSLPLLEPRVGDVLYTRIRSGGVSIEEIMGEERQAQATYLINRGARIIQREGKAFIWPESERA